MSHNLEQILEDSVSNNYPKKEISDVSKKNGLIFKNTQKIFDSEDLELTSKKDNKVFMLSNGKISNISENNSGKDMIVPTMNLETNCDILGGSKDQYNINFNFGEKIEDNDNFISQLSEISSYLNQINEFFFEINGFSSIPQNIPISPPSNNLKNQNSNQINKEKEVDKLQIKKNPDPKDNELNKKRRRGKGKYNCKDSKNKNQKIGRLKLIFCNSIWKFINNVILKVYNYDIGHYINQKQLLKINFNIINNNKADFNKQLLKKTLKEIFYHDISVKFTIYPKDFNKKLINRLLNEEDLKKRKIFHNLFNKTFAECIDQIIGKKRINELKDLEKYFEDEIKSKEDRENLKELLTNFKEIILSKKSRKRE
jgi:hypothetical protein